MPAIIHVDLLRRSKIRAEARLFILARVLWKSEALATDVPSRGTPTRPQTMTQASLSPQFCFSSGALRDFLRLSRASVDDSISQNLNALMTPAQRGFDPQSTFQRAITPPTRQVDHEACEHFRDKILFPAWQSRTQVLEYCGLVAKSPDPDDPEALSREMETRLDRERTTNEQLDPYSGRFLPRETRTQKLATLIRQERAIENVVRNRTWDVVQQRCVTPVTSWEEAAGQWRNAQNPSKLPGPE